MFLLSILNLFFLSELTFAQETWTATSLVNAPTERQGHTSVWTGTKMIIWGGDYYNIGYNTGGSFDPVTNTWTATSTTNAPQGRGAHSAVWTGSKMIVWGGATILNFNSGGKYDPLTDSWVPTSITNAPSARYFHSAVWTGSKMIIWGGFTNSGVTNTGGLYESNTDNWVLTSTSNAPVARYLHSCVWTGSKMIVWGGVPSNGITYYNSGGIYDPEDDTWKPTSMINAPSVRCSHSAIWTGSKMIIWGGVIGIEIYTSTGGIYDPSNDTWTQVSLNNAPSPRAYQKAVWTGTRMIVWGGIGTNYQVNTGGIYDPATDSWVSTTVANAPESREFHTSIWTGTKMIVWGGNDTGNLLITGGIYNNPAVIGIAQLGKGVPSEFVLYQNYPNPFNPTTKIKFDVPRSENVKIVILDLLGREVEKIADQKLNPGSYEADWDASKFSSGIYFYRLVTESFAETKKMILLK